MNATAPRFPVITLMRVIRLTYSVPSGLTRNKWRRRILKLRVLETQDFALVLDLPEVEFNLVNCFSMEYRLLVSRRTGCADCPSIKRMGKTNKAVHQWLLTSEEDGRSVQVSMRVEDLCEITTCRQQGGSLWQAKLKEAFIKYRISCRGCRDMPIDVCGCVWKETSDD